MGVHGQFAARGTAADRSVAVVGMACRVPGAAGPDELWRLLSDGVDATGTTPPERYDAEALYAPGALPGKIAARRGGYVDGVADFDAEFFGMSAAEAVELDPQQRLLLMTAWEALEDAGQRPDLLAGSRTGVFVGGSRADYLENAFQRGLEAATAAQFNNVRSLLPARLSHFFDLRGPSVVVETACSSSLVAVHQAVQSLRAGESPLALVAGVNLPLRPHEGIMMSQAGGMARDGRSKFGAALADGHSPSDAVSVVVLKPLAAALADGDRVRAVIAGSAIGNDGRTSETVLNPSLTGQREVLGWAYADAGIEPSEVDYVEAHGSGSPLLDPLELTALGQVLGAGRPADRPLLVGSVKSNIGHAEAAAGLTGLIKAVLCLEHGQIPASLHAGTPNPAVAWDELPLEIPAELRDLPELGRPAVAGVSAQGSTALNAHVVLLQAETTKYQVADERTDEPQLLALSAETPEALAALARAYAAYLAPGGRGAAFALHDICRSAAMRRQHLKHRLAVVGRSHAELIDALSATGGHTDPAMAEIAYRYQAGGALDWDEVFGGGGAFVPLPTYQWQTKRYWPGEQHDEDDLATWILGRHSRTDFHDESALADIGIDSLAKLQLVIELEKRIGREVDLAALDRLRTVGDLRRWTSELEVAAR
ncbi:Phosphopantetheine attachment site [Saccharopolyspora antimicrobica]|uniref:Phosphopantetheine attachment site n=1 Tax=Saccharopolyspora antimicrobica TaxID=455193 RepID=A0A1I5GYX3_9PSEU|nr:beta-ketoacyl synthase N-terminal-like domain-containing protein [Saccharopolyspora antimicrobica]RKT89277.1 phosphopantetheine binding protein [Saccharopolyspora antimicrobica]SFO41159.1 Phosphopantetheine attachment site [Saccharopolyspora antimicrobica]